MSVSAQEVTADALRDLYIEIPTRFGPNRQYYLDRTDADVITKCVLDALSDNGYAVAKLPEPVQTFAGDEDENAWSAWLHDGIEVVAFQDSEVHFQGQVLDDPRFLAEILLAAADAAERGES